MKDKIKLYALANTGKAYTYVNSKKLNSCKDVLPSFKEIGEHLIGLKINKSKYTPLVVQCSKDKFDEIMSEIRTKVPMSGNNMKIDFVISGNLRPVVQISKFEDYTKSNLDI